MATPKLLFINGCGSLEGDINVVLLALSRFQPGQFDIHAVSVPRGSVFEKLNAMEHITLIPMEIGGSEARHPARSGRRYELSEAVLAVGRLVNIIFREKIDVIYSIDRTIAAYLACLVARLTGRPFVLCAAYPFYPDHNVLNRLVLRNATRVQVHSNYLRGHLQPYCISPSRIVKILDAIEVEKYDPYYPGSQVRQDLGISASAPLVLLAGRVNQYKGHDDLINAAAIVLQQRPDTHFVIAGRVDKTPISYEGRMTWYQDVLTDLVAQHNLDKHVHFVGYYPDLPGLMAAANIITMPSREEPFGLVALEGMAVAKPIVATRAGGVPEFVIDGEVGILVPPQSPSALADALLTLINNPEYAKSLGMRGRERAERLHSAPQFANAVARLLCDVLPDSHEGSSMETRVASSLSSQRDNGL